MTSYDYTRRQGVDEIGWNRFSALADTLAELLAAEKVDLIVGVARAGLIPAATVAARLRLDLAPVRLTRRESDAVVRKRPEWKVDVPADLAGRVVAVVDEIADTGETLSMVEERCAQKGAERVTTTALVAHSWAEPFPTHAALVTDALVIFPWDREVFVDGRWTVHPELAAALARQRGPDGREPQPPP